ncbi:hypothetical protein P4114_02440 [Pseudomonas aeruginosa]|nr:hypothetical protein [Pseudomonas aeruginosa]
MRRLLSLLILVLPLSACVVYDRNDHRHRPDYRYERYHDRDRDNRGRDWEPFLAGAPRRRSLALILRWRRSAGPVPAPARRTLPRPATGCGRRG